MGLKVADIVRTVIGSLADATNDPYIRMGLGTPGNKIAVFNKTEVTGQAFLPSPKALAIIVEGIASVLSIGSLVDVLTNSSGVTITPGTLVYANANNTFSRAHPAATGLLGVVVSESVPDTEKGLIAISGIVPVQLEDSLSPNAGDLLYVGSSIGKFTTSGSEAIAVVINNTNYGTIEQCDALLRIPAT